jgi:hypothetical protein
MWNLRAIGSEIRSVDQPYMKVEKTFINYETETMVTA